MSSANDPQKQDASPGEGDTVGKGVFSNIITEVPSSPHNEVDEQDLASQTAKLTLDEHTTNAVLPPKPSTTTLLAEEPAPATMDENIDPKPVHATTALQPETESADTMRADERAATAKMTDTNNTITSENANTEPQSNDEANTSRLSTYINLRDEMMLYQRYITTDDNEMLERARQAAHIGRTLYASHEKHGDLPLDIQLDTLFVLGCSDEDNCYERMEEALALARQAMSVGALDREEGERLLKACEGIMGERARVSSGSDDDGSYESEDEDKDKDVFEDEGERGNDDDEWNDALP